jgi:hypothetical protein
MLEQQQQDVLIKLTIYIFKKKSGSTVKFIQNIPKKHNPEFYLIPPFNKQKKISRIFFFNHFHKFSLSHSSLPSLIHTYKHFLSPFRDFSLNKVIFYLKKRKNCHKFLPSVLLFSWRTKTSRKGICVFRLL